jgi:hypothetical protein
MKSMVMTASFFQRRGGGSAYSQESARAFRLATGRAFGHLNTQTLEEAKATEQFYGDFGRTAEITLKVAGEDQARVQYIREKDIDRAEEKSKQFLKELESISPSLKTVMTTALHQNGVFYSGIFAMQAFILLTKGLGKQASKHKFVVEVVDENQVIIKEIVEYTALKLISLEEVREPSLSEAGLEFRELTKREEKVLEKKRQTCLAALGQSGEASEAEPLSLSEPLIATIRYELKYCPQQGNYQLTKLSKDDISIPSIPVEKLLFEADNQVQEKLKLFFEKLIEIIKTAILALTSQFSHSEGPLAKPDCTMIRPRF